MSFDSLFQAKAKTGISNVHVFTVIDLQRRGLSSYCTEKNSFLRFAVCASGPEKRWSFKSVIA